MTCPRCGLTTATALCPRCLLASDAPPVPPGLEMGPEIGRGGMGRVYRARHVGLQRDVAVKVLPSHVAGDESFLARFTREAQTLARVAHPHIIAIHDFGTSPDGQSYLVMELADGGTLAQALPLEPSRVLDVALQICDGMAHAHARGLVHRDLKPTNILFNTDGDVKIADFGLARLFDDERGDGLTRSSVVLGTPGYMPPEARAGAPPDPRGDVYALGVLLRALWGGELSTPRWLRPIVRRATAIDPQQRYPDAGVLARALRAAAPPGQGTPLAADERSWAQAVALTLAGATAVALYAVLVSLTPRIVPAEDDLPFVVFGTRPLADGRVWTRARFETWPTLAAAGAIAIALTAYGALMRHWRHGGLLVVEPDRSLGGSRTLFQLGIVIVGAFGLNLLLERLAPAAATYVPVLGGVLELAMLFVLWGVVLDSKRTGRSLKSEPLFWCGLALALLPPCVSFARLILR